MSDYDESYDDPSYNEYDDGAGEYDHCASHEGFPEKRVESAYSGIDTIAQDCWTAS